MVASTGLPKKGRTRGRAPWLSPRRACVGHLSGDYPRKSHVKDGFKSKSLNSLAPWSRMPQEH